MNATKPNRFFEYMWAFCTCFLKGCTCSCVIITSGLCLRHDSNFCSSLFLQVSFQRLWAPVVVFENLKGPLRDTRVLVLEGSLLDPVFAAQRAVGANHLGGHSGPSVVLEGGPRLAAPGLWSSSSRFQFLRRLARGSANWR